VITVKLHCGNVKKKKMKVSSLAELARMAQILEPDDVDLYRGIGAASPRLNSLPWCGAYRPAKLESTKDGPVMAPLIAIIDDDIGIRNALRGLMRSASYRAESFPSVEEFAASKAATLSDCVITDAAIQGTRGLELAALLKSRGWTVPVILISALIDEDLELKAIFNGARCLLRKPVESNALISLAEESIVSRPIAPRPPAPADQRL
jgi:FixJ family two-component response regulator